MLLKNRFARKRRVVRGLVWQKEGASQTLTRSGIQFRSVYCVSSVLCNKLALQPTGAIFLGLARYMNVYFVCDVSFTLDHATFELRSVSLERFWYPFSGRECHQTNPLRAQERRACFLSIERTARVVLLFSVSK